MIDDTCGGMIASTFEEMNRRVVQAFDKETQRACTRCNGSHPDGHEDFCPNTLERRRMCSFEVRGRAQSAGSKRAFYNAKLKRAMIVDANPESRPWKAIVSDAALQAMSTAPPLNGPVQASFTFIETRPQSHFNSKRELNAQGRRTPYPAKKPDALKLARGVEDALTGIVYVDDSQIVVEHLYKRYGDHDCVQVTVEELELIERSEG